MSFLGMYDDELYAEDPPPVVVRDTAQDTKGIMNLPSLSHTVRKMERQIITDDSEKREVELRLQRSEQQINRLQTQLQNLMIAVNKMVTEINNLGYELDRKISRRD